jgi:cytochrome c peroxidase
MFARPNPLAVALLALTGCGKLADSVFCGSGGCGWAPGEWARVAALANPGAPEPDLSNEWRDNGVAGLLGKQFFFDDAFSGNATQVDALKRTSPPARAPAGQAIGIACATCHDLEYGGVDVSSSPGHVSVGAGWTDVNALSVINSPYRQVVFWNGRADSLWALNVIVAESSTTMNGNRLRTAHQIATRYKMAWEKAFGAGSIDADAIAALPPDGKPGNDPNTCAPTDPNEPFGDAYDCLSAQQKDMVTRVLVNWAKAIAVFESKLVSVDSPFDEFVAEGPSSTRISAAAIRGARLFVGKAACVDCHSGPQLTDELFHNIGVPQTGVAVPRTGDCSTSRVPCNCSPAGSGPCLPWGAWDGLNKLRGSSAKWLRTAAWSGNPGDTSRDPYVHLPLTDALKGAWRTPSLRNVARTAPYMHDGGYATLQEVVWHYNSGGQTAGPEQVGDLSPQIKPLMLTDAEQSDLVAFLESLTGAPLASEIKAVPGLPAAPDGTGGTSGNSGAGGMGGSGALGSAGAGPVGGSGAGGTAAGGRGDDGRGRLRGRPVDAAEVLRRAARHPAHHQFRRRGAGALPSRSGRRAAPAASSRAR